MLDFNERLISNSTPEFVPLPSNHSKSPVDEITAGKISPNTIPILHKDIETHPGAASNSSSVPSQTISTTGFGIRPAVPLPSSSVPKETVSVISRITEQFSPDEMQTFSHQDAPGNIKQRYMRRSPSDGQVKQIRQFAWPSTMDAPSKEFVPLKSQDSSVDSFPSPKLVDGNPKRHLLMGRNDQSRESHTLTEITSTGGSNSGSSSDSYRSSGTYVVSKNLSKSSLPLPSDTKEQQLNVQSLLSSAKKANSFYHHSFSQTHETLPSQVPQESPSIANSASVSQRNNSSSSNSNSLTNLFRYEELLERVRKIPYKHLEEQQQIIGSFESWKEKTLNSFHSSTLTESSSDSRQFSATGASSSSTKGEEQSATPLRVNANVPDVDPVDRSVFSKNNTEVTQGDESKFPGEREAGFLDTLGNQSSGKTSRINQRSLSKNSNDYNESSGIEEYVSVPLHENNTDNKNGNSSVNVALQKPPNSTGDTSLITSAKPFVLNTNPETSRSISGGNNTSFLITGEMTTSSQKWQSQLRTSLFSPVEDRQGFKQFRPNSDSASSSTSFNKSASSSASVRTRNDHLTDLSSGYSRDVEYTSSDSTQAENNGSNMRDYSHQLPSYFVVDDSRMTGFSTDKTVSELARLGPFSFDSNQSNKFDTDLLGSGAVGSDLVDIDLNADKTSLELPEQGHVLSESSRSDKFDALIQKEGVDNQHEAFRIKPAVPSAEKLFSPQAYRTSDVHSAIRHKSDLANISATPSSSLPDSHINYLNLTESDKSVVPKDSYVHVIDVASPSSLSSFSSFLTSDDNPPNQSETSWLFSGDKDSSHLARISESTTDTSSPYFVTSSVSANPQNRSVGDNFKQYSGKSFSETESTKQVGFYQNFF